MSWRHEYKEKYMQVTRLVLRNDAPEEIKENIGPTASTRLTTEGIGIVAELTQYVQDYVKMLLADKGWPKFQRRTSITCPVTGEETDHPFGLSNRAWQLIEKGIVHEKELEEKAIGEKKYCFHSGWGWDLTREYNESLTSRYSVAYKSLDGEGYLGRDYLQGFILKLLGKRTRDIHFPHGIGHPSDMGLIWLPAEPFDAKLLSQRKLVVVNLHPKDAELLRRSMTLVRWAHDHAVREARSEGSNLLLALASDPDSIEKFNAVRSNDVQEK